ncbi:unnamed protein product [Caenorhabditis brenneri]
MSWPKDFPTNGTWKFSNFPELFDTNRSSLQITPSFYYTWCLELHQAEGGEYIYPVLQCQNADDRMFVRIYLSIVNKKNREQSKILEERQKFDVSGRTSKHYLLVSELFNEEEGWLEEGVLTIEYGIHVEYLVRENGSRLFNIFEPVPGKTQGFKGSKRDVYAHKQLLKIHAKDITFSQNIIEVPPVVLSYMLGDCMQIVQGIRFLELYDTDFPNMLFWARHFKLQNVIRFCEKDAMAKNYLRRNFKEQFRCAFLNNWNHYLAPMCKVYL